MSETIVFDAAKATADFSSFFDKFQSIYNSTIVENKSLSSRRNFSLKPYITLDISKACITKNRLHNAWINARGALNEQAAMTAYKSYRSALKTVIFKAKMNYFSKKFERCKDNVRQSWKVINEIRCKNSNRTLPSYIDINNNIITERRRIIQELNNYFVSVADNLNNSKYTQLGSAPDFKKFLKNRITANIELSNIKVCEIDEIIKNLNPNKSSDFSPRLLKLIQLSLSPILRNLLNNCMHSCVFPDRLKIAKVLPLYKSGDVNELSNYRPISILPIFSKIFEKLLYSRLKNFLDDDDAIDNFQFGFRPQHSTTHALHSAVSSIANAINNSNKCLGIFIDFRKAFDTVNHRVLLEKLDHYGIRGRALDLFTSYLTGRFQFVYDTPDIS